MSSFHLENTEKKGFRVSFDLSTLFRSGRAELRISLTARWQSRSGEQGVNFCGVLETRLVCIVVLPFMHYKSAQGTSMRTVSALLGGTVARHKGSEQCAVQYHFLPHALYVFRTCT